MPVEVSRAKLVVQRSRFHAHLYEISDEEEVRDVLKWHRKEYRRARHHCWALRLVIDGRVVEKYKDDGEVGHPGKVLLSVLENRGLDSHLLVVSRIFGGIKLGVGGVSRAFREAGMMAVENADNV